MVLDMSRQCCISVLRIPLATSSRCYGVRIVSMPTSNVWRRCSATSACIQPSIHTSQQLRGRSIIRPTKTNNHIPAFSQPQRSSFKTSSLNQAKPEDHQPATTKPTYAPPTTGLLARTLPPALLPFAELSRLQSPGGTIYLLAPCIFSLLLSASLVAPPASPSTLLHTAALFTLGAVAMRGAGCTINDLWDRNLDPHVERTRLRPLARRAVTVPAALTWAGIQCLAGLAVLWQFPPGAVALAVPSLALVTTYPLAKRVTGYPQFVLGLTFSWGALLGLPALGVDVGALVPALDGLAALVASFGVGSLVETSSQLAVAPEAAVAASALLYSSCVLWTLLYDTIYAFQDIRDDRAAGIRSSALSFSALVGGGFSPKAPLVALGVAQISLLAAVGYVVGFGPLYYAGTCGVGGAVLAAMVRGVRLGDVQSCRVWFARGAWLGLGGLSLGFLAEWLSRWMVAEDEDKQEHALTQESAPP